MYIFLSFFITFAVQNGKYGICIFNFEWRAIAGKESKFLSIETERIIHIFVPSQLDDFQSIELM